MTDPSDSSASQGWGGLKSSLLGVMATSVALFHTRLALLTAELEEEKQRLLATMAWGAVAVLMVCFALAFGAGFVVVLFWETHRLLALGAMTGLFVFLALLSVWRIRRLLNRSAPMLKATLAELDADREALSPRRQP